MALHQSRRELLHAFRYPESRAAWDCRGFDQALECGDQPRIVFTNRPTPASGAANLPLRQRCRIEIILAAIDRRTRQPGNLRHGRQTPQPALRTSPTANNRRPCSSSLELGKFTAHKKNGAKGSFLKAIDLLRAEILKGGAEMASLVERLPSEHQHPVSDYERILTAARKASRNG
jgi:hypothetical protein